MRKILKFFGLALHSDLVRAWGYIDAVTSAAKDSGDVIVGGDYTVVRDLHLIGGKRIIVPPGVRGSLIMNCVLT